MLRAIFGVNVATQPESSSSSSSQQKDALITEILLPSCLEVSINNSGDVAFYQSYYEEFQQEISRAFDEIRKSDQTKETKRYCMWFLCPLYLCISITIPPTYQPTYLLTNLPTYLATNLLTNQPTYLPTNLPT